MSRSPGVARRSGPQQLLYYSRRQGSLAEPPARKVQYKRTVGSPGDLARKSLAKLNPHQPSPAAHANTTTHAAQACGRSTSLQHVTSARCATFIPSGLDTSAFCSLKTEIWGERKLQEWSLCRRIWSEFNKYSKKWHLQINIMIFYGFFNRKHLNK